MPSWVVRAILLFALGSASFSWLSVGKMQREITRLRSEAAATASHIRHRTSLLEANTFPPLAHTQQETVSLRQSTPPPVTPCPTAVARQISESAVEATTFSEGFNATPVRWRVLIFVNLRVGSLRRLCDSLQAAHINETVPLTFLIEAFQPKEVYDFVHAFRWNHGPVTVTARHSKGGLINAIMEGWYPANNDEWGIFLEDDIEVSPYFMQYLQAARPLCEDAGGCIGISLYSPKLNELVKPKAVITPELQQNGGSPLYMAQVPCSWGAAYRPQHWRKFRLWSVTQPREGKYGGDLELGRGSGWAASWKRYLLELILVMDWSVMYPFFGDHSAYSTNHLELGEHITAADTEHKKADYTHPLRHDLMPLQPPRVWFDHQYNVIATKIENLAIRKSRGLPNRPPTGCAAYSLEGHRTLTEPDGVTVVMTFFYSPVRFMAFLKNIKAFCAYESVKRIIVMWHNRQYVPQTMAWCHPESTTSVHFLMPRVKDTLSNRFTPTYRIRTEAVVTVDDDILISERDVVRMATVLRDANYTAVVGPFPRWYSQRPGQSPSLKYHFKPPASAPVGYPIMLTKIHVSHFSLYYHYFCDSAYEAMRQRVAEIQNAEDLLYIRVAADRHLPPVIFVLTADTIDDTGKVGLHSKGSGHKHQDDRSAALELFGYNDSFWSSRVVLPPGTAVSDYAHDMWARQHALVRE